MYRNLILLTILTVLTATGIFWFIGRPSSPVLPTLNPRSGNLSPSAEFVNVRSSTEYYREQILKQPNSVKNYVALAQLFLQEARISGDELSNLPKAGRLLDQALDLDPNHFEALVTQANLFNKMHQFEQARALAEDLIDRNPASGATYGILVDALVELGEYEQAVTAADRLIQTRPDLGAYARISYLRELHGDTDGSLSAMHLAVEAGVAGQENRAWALQKLATLYLSEAKLDTAAFIFNGSLEERPGYAPAVAGLAQIEMIRGQYENALGLINRAYNMAPHPGFLELMLDAQTALGRHAKADSLIQTILKTYKAEEALGSNVNMEFADFCADHDILLGESLRRAEAEYNRRPNHLHALETFAWTLHKNGRSAEALPFIERAMRLETQDAMVEYRAGRIYLAAGQTEKATAYLRQALMHNLHIESTLAAAEARILIKSLGPA